MRIAILNLPIDNNYGGHLQRYALIRVLERMGHKPIVLNCRTYQKKTFVGLLRCVLACTARTFINFIPESKISQRLNDRFGDPMKASESFFKKYIAHTKPLYLKTQLQDLQEFDAYIVGSDQVWRKNYMYWGSTESYLGTYLFDFVHKNKLKIAYSVSFGKDEDDYTLEEITQLKQFYESFTAVSVREKSALDILQNRGWISPQAQWTLDPTLLLTDKDYWAIINDNKTIGNKGYILTYILDPDDDKNEYIRNIALDKKIVSMGLKARANVSIPQWLRNFAEADYVITDSYHGIVFSIIFNKPFKLFMNERRGVARFETLLGSLGMSSDSSKMSLSDWERVNEKLTDYRKGSLEFLMKNLK